MAFTYDSEEDRFAGDIFDIESLAHDQQDSPAFMQTPGTDPYEVARIEKVRDRQPDGSMRIRVNGYDDSDGPRNLKGFMDSYADNAYTITRDEQSQEPVSMDRIGQQPEFRNPGRPQPSEPGYSGRPLSVSGDNNVTENGLSWSQEVDSDEAAGALIRGIGERDERARDDFMRSTFGTMRNPNF